jgi:hypothetical protein
MVNTATSEVLETREERLISNPGDKGKVLVVGRYRARVASRRTSVAGLSSRSPT